MNARQDLQKLRSRIVQNPEKLKEVCKGFIYSNVYALGFKQHVEPKFG